MVRLSDYLNFKLIGESKGIIHPFNSDCLNEMKISIPEIFNMVELKFKENEISSKELKYLVNKADDECFKLRPILLNPSEITSVFPETLLIRNHMYCINIIVYDRDNDTEIDEISLEDLSKYTHNAFYSKQKTPSMVMFTDELFCCAILTKKRNINLVGGYTVDEVKYTLIKFINSIQHAFKETGRNYEIKINSLKLHNIAASTSIPISKIDIYGTTGFLKAYKIPFKYTPETHDLLTVKLFPKSFPSINIRVFPSGGIFCFGFKSTEEINIVMSVFASIIKTFIRSDNIFGITYKEWKENNIAHWKIQEKNKLKKRIKRIDNWKKIKNELCDEMSQ